MNFVRRWRPARKPAQRHSDRRGSAFGNAEIDDAMAGQYIDVGVWRVAVVDKILVKSRSGGIKATIITIGHARTGVVEKIPPR
jgi:hypothetical protein